jgi:murein DD-endopeptidase MepM/ murein hydrolase activator NlpD
MTPFKRGYLITQKFGVNPQNYLPLGFNGHEGIDLVPTDEKGNVLSNQAGTDNWDVLAVEDGEVVRDYDDPKAGGYGIYAVVYNSLTKRAWWYGHFSENFVALGAKIKRGDRLGHMGSTGNSTGAHLHLGLRLADNNGNAINTDNGYKGFVNPQEALDSFNKNNPFPPINVPTPQPVIDWQTKYNDLNKQFEDYKKTEAQRITDALQPSLNKMAQAKADISIVLKDLS